MCPFYRFLKGCLKIISIVAAFSSRTVCICGSRRDLREERRGDSEQSLSAEERVGGMVGVEGMEYLDRRGLLTGQFIILHTFNSI